MGIGTIGRCVIDCASKMNMKVWGLCRSNDSKNKETSAADKYFLNAELDEFLSGCDYVINALPSTKSTSN